VVFSFALMEKIIFVFAKFAVTSSGILSRSDSTDSD